MQWRVRNALRGQLAPGDEVRAVARDEIGRDYWVVTDREVIQVKGRAVAQRLPLADAVGTVTTQQAAGVTVRVSSRRTGGRQMLTSFRKPNDVTRRLAELFESPANPS